MKRKLLFAMVALLCSVVSWAQTDVTSTYIANPSFELSAAGTSRTTRYAATGTVTDAIYGWTLAQGNPDNGYEDVQVNDNSTSGAGFGTTVTPANGTYYFFNRRGWAQVTNSLKATSLSNLSAGTYFLSVKYKAAYNDNNGESSGPAVTVKAVQGESELAARTSINGPKAPGDTYFNVSGWQTIGVHFSLSSEGSVDFVISYSLDGRHGRGDVLLDDVRLYNLSAATSSDPADVTGWIANASFENNTFTGTQADGSSIGSNGGTINKPTGYTCYFNIDGWRDCTANETNPADGNWCMNSWFGTINEQKFYQTINSLPEGVYEISAKVRTDQTSTDGIYTYGIAGGTTYKSASWDASKMAGTWNSMENWQTLTARVPITPSGSLQFGLRSDKFIQFDDFHLTYYGNAVEVYNPAGFTSGSSATAGTWYAFEVLSEGWYTITPSAAGTFGYTQNDDDDAGAVSRFYATTTGKYQYLTAGTFYFKTNTAATVTIAQTAVHAGDNVTGYINDPSFEHVALSNSGTVTSTDLLDWLGTSDAPEAFISYKINDRNYTNVDGNNLYNTWGGSPANGYYLKQALRNLPIGKYRMSCYVSSDSPNTVNVALGGSSEDATCTGKTNGVQASVDLTNESAGDVLINLSSTTWFKADVFQLTLLANLIVNDAEELPVSGAMEAGKWYYFTAGADDKWIDAPTPANIVFTTDGSQFTDISGTALSDMTMTSGTKYYIKSSSSQTVAVSEQTIANGTYYLYNPYTGRFLGGGATYGTSALVDKYGVPFNLELHADGYMLKFVDWDKYLYGPNWLFVDGVNGVKFKITESTVGDYTGYAFYNKDETTNNRLYVYLVEDENKYRVARNATIGNNCADEAQTVWQLKSVAEHNTIVNAYPADNINHVIAAASMEDKTNAAGFESYLSTYYDANDMTDKIGTAKFGDNAGDWTWTQVENRSGDGGCRYETAWQYKRTGSYTQTIAAANLPAGVYKVEMGGFDRHASESSDISLASSYGSLSSSYLKANDEQVRMKAWADVEGRPTTSETQANSINSGAADNVVYVYLNGSTDLNLKVCKPAYLAECYFNFGNFRLTRYTLKDADDADYTALNTAIAAAEAHTLGFENSEYAPYNNIERLTELATAKAINPAGENTKEAVDASTNALNDGVWIANDGDVECVYNGDFSLGSWGLGGWSRPESWGKNLPSDEQGITVDILKAAGATTGSAYYNQTGSLVYGNTGNYTMPLKANTIYVLTFKYASYQGGEAGDDGSNDGITVSVLNEHDEGMEDYPYEENNKIYTTSESFDTKTIKFVTGAAGDYVLTLANSGNTVITDVSITKASQTLTLPSATQYAAGTYPEVALDRTFSTEYYSTLCLPFAMDETATDAAIGEEVYELTGVEGSSIKFAAASTMTAGKPYLVLAKSSTLTVDDVYLNPATIASSTPVKSGDNKTTVTFEGTFTSTTAPMGSYVVSNDNLYLVNSPVNVPPYRGYFTVETEGTTKNFVLDFGDADAISDVRGKMEDGRSEIFNLAGQKMSKLQRGVNIVNGKKVLVR